MIDDLKKTSETILITEPFVVNTSSRYQEALDKDILAKTTRKKHLCTIFISVTLV